VQRQLFFTICGALKLKLKDYDEFVEGMAQVVKEVNSRTCFLDREEEKRNRSVEGANKKLDENQSAFEKFQNKFNTLLLRNYEINTKESFK
jgi:hypothetical protein